MQIQLQWKTNKPTSIGEQNDKRYRISLEGAENRHFLNTDEKENMVNADRQQKSAAGPHFCSFATDSHYYETATNAMLFNGR